MLHYSDLIIALHFSSDLHFDVVAEHCYTRDNTHSIDLQGKWQQHPQQQGQPAHSPMTLQVYTGTNWPHDSSMVTTVRTRIGSTSSWHTWHSTIQTTQDFSRAVRQQQQYSQMQNYEHQPHMMMKQDGGLQCQETCSILHFHQHMQRLSSYSCETKAVGDNNGFETFRVLHQRFSLPIGARSIEYLTTLLKPKCEEQSFEENFLQWEYAVARYELDNGQGLPDTVKIAILLNETKGALQQHLQLRAGQVTTYAAMRSIVLEYSKATTAVSKLKMMHNPTTNNYNGLQPMDIGMIWKGHKGKDKGKSKRKNYRGNGTGFKGKGKGKMTGKGKATEEATDRQEKDKERTSMEERTTVKEKVWPFAQECQSTRFNSRMITNTSFL